MTHVDTTAALRGRRSTLITDTRSLLDRTPTGEWGPRQQLAFDSALEELERIEASLARHDRQSAAASDLREDEAAADFLERRAFGNRHMPVNHPTRIVDTWLRLGEDGLTAAQTQMLRNTMSTTTGSQGGFTVPPSVARAFVDAMKLYSAVRGAAEIIPTETGGPMNWPTTDGTAEIGERLAENGATTSADPSFGTVALNTYKYGSKLVTVPIELLQDSGIDLEGMVRQRMASRIGRAANQDFTNGTGSGQPLGVVTAAGAGKVGASGQTLTVTCDDLVDLLHAVDPAYRPRARWMMADGSLKVVRKLKDSSGMPIWLPGFEGSDNQGPPATLLGYPYAVNPDVPAMAANAKSILFGDFSCYKIRDALAVALYRFTDSAYAKLGQVGFLGFSRHGGTFADVGASLRCYQNSAT